jgi:hypothetical protein
MPTATFAQASAPLWWCAPLRQYYPAVPTCPASWVQVARPPGLSALPQTSNPPAADKTNTLAIAAIVGSSPETRKLVCSGPDALSYLKNKLREISGSPDLELQDVAAVDSRTCRVTVVENGRRTPGKLKLERYSGYERISWDNDAGGRSISWPTGVRFNEPPTDPMEDIRRSAEKNPNKMVGCGVQGPKQVYTTYDVCYAVMKLSREIHNPTKPYAGYHLLQVCGSLSRPTCLAMIAELRKLHSNENSKSTMALTEECAGDLQSNSSASGEEKARYMNTCQDLVKAFLR